MTAHMDDEVITRPAKPAKAAKGLGRGLSALLSESYSDSVEEEREGQAAAASANTNSAAPSGGSSMLPTDKLQPGRFQPRTRFDEEALAELAASVTRNGLVQPILVRPIDGNRYEIIAGERRWRAAQIAKLDIVPVIIRTLSDQQSLELALVENVQRQDLNPLEESAGYQRLMDEFGYTQEELSDTVGKSRSHIANLLRLLVLPEEVKSLMEEGKITMGHARALLRVAKPVDIAREIARKGLNVRQTERLIRRGEEPAPRRARAGSS
ncbi:MAG: ParB/RepB/Spo0J family partition protein, partial [Fimbriimonadaceae bacterium]